MKWVAAEVSRDMFVNIMEQYHSDAHVGKSARSMKAASASKHLEGLLRDGARYGVSELMKVRYSEINRPVTSEEMCSVRRAAEKVGLWRFCDPARHDGFNIGQLRCRSIRLINCCTMVSRLPILCRN